MAESYDPASRCWLPRRKKPSASSGSGRLSAGVRFSFMIFGYNTNGFAHHRLEDALAVLAGLGYEGVALTLDHHALNPFDPHLFDQLHRVRDLLRAYRLRAVIETGARFLLDARRKHQPTLLDPDPLPCRPPAATPAGLCPPPPGSLGNPAASPWGGPPTWRRLSGSALSASG